MMFASRSLSASMASLALAIVVSSPASAQSNTANEAMMNLVLQVQQLQDEIRMLRGQLEEQGFEIEDLKRRQRDQYLDLDQRLGELGSGASAPQSVPGVSVPPVGDAVSPAALGATPANGATAAVPVTRPEVGPATPVATAGAQDLPAVSERPDAASAVTSIAAPQATTSVTTATPEMEQAAYDAAFQSLRDLRYADASRGFQDFLRQYGDSALAGNAQYWLGESYYVTRNYDIALSAFETLLSRYPDSVKRGDGLLKIGFTHYELKQYEQARAALEQVQREFPDSTFARLAESRLRSMRLEGHF